MPHNLRQLTQQYISAFDQKDLAAVAQLLSEDFTLTDPENDRLSPKDSVLALIENIFKSGGPSFSFSAKNILVQEQISIIEFELQIGEAIFDGVDIIEWQNGRMHELRAYLTQRKQ